MALEDAVVSDWFRRVPLKVCMLEDTSDMGV